MRSGFVSVCAVSVVWTCFALTSVGGDAFNLATNPSFDVAAESPNDPAPGWRYFSSGKVNVGLEIDVTRTGDHCIKLSAQNGAFAHLGIMQELTVDPSRQYEFVAYVRNDPTDALTPTAFGMIGMEWMDEEGKEIRRMTSSKWDRNLSRMRWKRYMLKADAPHDAVKARFVVYLYDGDKGAKGSCLIDDVEIRAK